MKTNIHEASEKIQGLKITAYKDPNTVILYLTIKEISYLNTINILCQDQI